MSCNECGGNTSNIMTCALLTAIASTVPMVRALAVYDQDPIWRHLPGRNARLAHRPTHS
jgi:hypothetical protein